MRFWTLVSTAVLLAGCGGPVEATDYPSGGTAPLGGSGPVETPNGGDSGALVVWLGGSEAGGVTTGGAQTGGVPTGGEETGGAPTGGVATGGAETGGMPTGGAGTGGAPTGGIQPTGGAPTGGWVPTGGLMTGGVLTGGTTTGGVATGGFTAGGTGGNDCCPVQCESWWTYSQNPSDPDAARYDVQNYFDCLEIECGPGAGQSLCVWVPDLIRNECYVCNAS